MSESSATVAVFGVTFDTAALVERRYAEPAWHLPLLRWHGGALTAAGTALSG